MIEEYVHFCEPEQGSLIGDESDEDTKRDLLKVSWTV
jgi:hypothetical protein